MIRYHFVILEGFIKGFFSLFQGVCVCVFLKSDDCIVKEEGKKREKDTEADPREKKKERKKKRKKVERVWFCHDPYDFQLIYKKTI